MILSDNELQTYLMDLVDPPDRSLVNPASIDIRVGKHAMVQYGTDWHKVLLDTNGPDLTVPPYELVLVETYEVLSVPSQFAVDLRLKSSMARLGWNHSLAFWFDPGWSGIGTMEIINQSKGPLTLHYKQRFAQIIVHQLSSPASNPYQGRYQHASTVEASK